MSSGRIVAAGFTNAVSSNDDFALVRYNADGSLDTSFSGDGMQTTNFGAADTLGGLVLQPDGKIVAAGAAGIDFGIARYLVTAGPPADTTPPETTITSGPAEGSTTNLSTPTFGFASSEPFSTFTCRIDLGSPFSCMSPFVTAVLPDGQHTFSVAATDPSANADASPATRTFTVQTAATTTPPPAPPAPPPPVPPPPPDVTPPTGKLSGSVSQKLGANQTYWSMSSAPTRRAAQP